MSPAALATVAAPDAIDYDPFADGELARVVPTTEPQREVWLADRLGRDASLAFNESVSLRLRGRLDTQALHAALQDLLDRHDALRACFGPDGETLCVRGHSQLALDLTDLAALPAASRADAVDARLRAAVDTPFALDHGPLFRAGLLRLGDDEHLLLLTAHHIVCDGWSWWVIVRELGALYALHCGVACAPLPAAETFADYALAEASHPDDAMFAADETYWLSRFAGGAPVLELPTDRPRPAQRSFASLREDHVLDAALVAALRSLGARHGASLFATLLTGFAAVLSRLAGQSQVVVGIPAAGQSIDGHARLVGHCVNLLPLRFDLDPAQPFVQALDHAQGTLLDALEHQRYTFGTLLRKLSITRDPGRMPLVSVMFNIDQALEHETTDFPGLTLDFASNPRSHENFELFINAVQARGELRLECQYNRDLFDAATVRRWLAAYETLLRGAVQGGDARIGALPMVGPEAMQALLALQPPATGYDADRGMHELFESQCDRAPERIAARFRERVLTYEQLDALANRVATLLRARGVHRGMLVGLALDRGIDMLAAWLGILKTGAGYVPLDPAFPHERLAYMVGDAGLAALVTQRAHAGRFDLRGRPVLVLDDCQDELEAAPSVRVVDRVDASSPAYVIYTSGSTGMPKGVQVPHRAVWNFIRAMQARPGIDAGDRLVAVTTLSFDIALLELLLPLSVGAEVILADRATAMDGALLAALLQDRGATLMQATPSTWRLLVDAGWRGGDAFRVLCGGEPLPPDLARALLSRSSEVWNLYGPTETTVWSTCGRVAMPEQGISIGTPIANTSVWVLDAQGQPCPLGVPGELCIGGDGVALGYLGREDLTAARFMADPFSKRAGARLYRSGDRGRWRADGTLEHLGRLDFQVKVRGYRIELGEIESALAACPGVGQAVVLAREDRPGDVRIVAYVVAQAGSRFDERAALDQVQRVLPDYMVPQHTVVVDALPLLPNGKIDRKALPAPAATTARSEAPTAPRNDLERTIAASMAQVLGLAQVGIHDDFFALGGHSLLAAQLTTRLNRELGRSLTLRALFDAPTVARMAAIAAVQDTAPARKAILHQPDQSRAPLSLVQERLWMLEQFTPGQLTYNTPSAHRLRGPLDVARFARAFETLVQRQSVLRTCFDTQDGETFQVVRDRVETGLLPLVDLTVFPADLRDEEANARIRALIHVPFDLRRAPLFVARLLRLDSDHHILFFMAHHAIWDGWSFDLLYSDLARIYGAYLEDREPQLEPLPVSYGDFSIWHRQWVQGPEYAEQLRFWRQRLGSGRGSGAAAMRALPTDRPRRPGMSGQGHPYPIAVARELTDRLHATAVGLESTLFVMLLTLYFALIAAVTGQGDILIATPVRGRNSDETEGLMGYFTNLLPLRLQIDPAQSFAWTLRQVKAVVLESFAHPDIRLEDLMRELNVRGADGSSVLYHSLFSFQDIRQRILQWGNVEHERVRISRPGATEDLGMWFVENELGLSGVLTYNVDLLFQDTAVMLWQRYHGMLESLVRDPTQSVAALTRFDDGLPRLMGRSEGTDAGADVVPAQQPAASAPVEPSPGLAQADSLLERMTEIWADVLGRDDIGPDDDFFALGGHSLQAVLMFHRASRLTEVNLPLATLFAAPTVRSLTQAYRAAGAGLACAAGTSGARADPWAPLVAMRPGSAGAPLFFVHAVGGNVLNYRPLAAQMPPGMPVYGLQALGLDGRTPPLTRIEDMAARYVEEIRSIQPVGPYHLAGGSMGGMIAYEMAQQLLIAGQHVALLALIDTSATFGRVQREDARRAMSRLRKLRRRVQGMSPLQALQALAAMSCAHARSAGAGRRIAACRRRGEEVPHALRYREIESVHFRAYQQYQVRPYPGALVLFRAQQQHGDQSIDATLGWDGLTAHLQVVHVPGDHDIIVEVPELACRLREIIEAVDNAVDVVPMEVSPACSPGPVRKQAAHAPDTAATGPRVVAIGQAGGVSPTANGMGMTPNRPGIATHYRRYATGNLLVIVSGLVSFPLLTRLLDNTQYGMLGYYGTLVVMAVAVGKLGAQHAMLRFYPHGGDAAQMRAFSTNLFYVPLAITLTLWACVAMALLAMDWAIGLRQSPLFWLVLIAAPLAVFGSLVETVLRVTERSRMVMYSRVCWRWLELALVLAALLLLERSAVAAYGGKLAAALAMVGFYAWWMQRHLGFSRTALDPVAVREGLIYGMPLVINEIMSVALLSLDRVMLKGLSGDFATVGIYSIGASLAVQVSVFMNASVFEAFLPAANRLYLTEGAAAVRALKTRILLPMTYVAVGVAALLGSFGTDLIVAASGSTKAASGPVFAWLGVLSALLPVLMLAGYGLLLEKRSTKVMLLMGVTVLVNTALNLAWIPRYGVMGSVYATMLSSVLLAAGHCLWVPRTLRQWPDRRAMVTAVSVAAGCIGIVLGSGLWGLRPGWPRLLLGGGAMAAGYGMGVLLLDARLRGMLRQWRRWGFQPQVPAAS